MCAALEPPERAAGLLPEIATKTQFLLLTLASTSPWPDLHHQHSINVAVMKIHCLCICAETAQQTKDFVY